MLCIPVIYPQCCLNVRCCLFIPFKSTCLDFNNLYKILKQKDKIFLLLGGVKPETKNTFWDLVKWLAQKCATTTLCSNTKTLERYRRRFLRSFCRVNKAKANWVNFFSIELREDYALSCWKLRTKQRLKCSCVSLLKYLHFSGWFHFIFIYF